MAESHTTPSLADVRARLPCTISLLDWDSEHFGFPVGRIDSSEIGEAELAAALDCARHAGLQLAYCTTRKVQPLPESIVDRYGGALVDCRATFTGRVDELLQHEVVQDESDITIREYLGGSATDELYALAVLAGRYSRFNVDPRVPRQRFEELYHRWIDRSIRREIANSVLVAETTDTSIVGFVTMARKNDTGVVALIAVSEAAQGHGLGKRLLQAAHRWMAAGRIATASVVTQLANEPACRLYHGAGYEMAHVESVYHFWLKSNDD